MFKKALYYLITLVFSNIQSRWALLFKKGTLSRNLGINTSLPLAASAMHEMQMVL